MFQSSGCIHLSILKPEEIINLNKKVVIGLSGGVDSSVAAFLLKNQGYEVVGVSLMNGYPGEEKVKNDAQKVADHLGISLQIVDIHEEFKEKIVNYMVDSYYQGETPNPCVFCNRLIKFKFLFEIADNIGAEFVATGHYANIVRTETGRYSILSAADDSKDQTYFLYQLPQKYLSRLIMPLADLKKDEVRKIASDNNLHVSTKKDSQEICFVSDDDYATFITAKKGYIPDSGDFVDTNGKVLGTHKGIIYYTIGQRKGLGIALGYPAYVKKLDKNNNQVVLSDNDELFTTEVYFNNTFWMSIEELSESEKCYGKIRFRHKAEPCVISRINDDMYIAEFETPVRAPAPGQAVVFYKNDMILGGGIIKDFE